MIISSGTVGYFLGLIRVYESRLFTKHDVERIVYAKNSAEAYQMLLETRYGKVLANYTLANMQDGLLAHLSEVKDLYMKYLDGNNDFLDGLFLPYDAMNVKVCIKSQKRGVSLDESLLTPLARYNYTTDEYKHSPLFSVVESLVKEIDDFETIDAVVDRAMAHILLRWAKKHSPAIEAYTTEWLHGLELITAVRSLSNGVSLSEYSLIGSGYLDEDSVVKDFRSFFAHKVLYEEWKQTKDYALLFSHLDARLKKFLHAASLESDGYGPLFAYCLKEQWTVDAIRNILVAHMSNLPPSHMQPFVNKIAFHEI